METRIERIAFLKGLGLYEAAKRFEAMSDEQFVSNVDFDNEKALRQRRGLA